MLVNNEHTETLTNSSNLNKFNQSEYNRLSKDNNLEDDFVNDKNYLYGRQLISPEVDDSIRFFSRRDYAHINTANLLKSTENELEQFPELDYELYDGDRKKRYEHDILDHSNSDDSWEIRNTAEIIANNKGVIEYINTLKKELNFYKKQNQDLLYNNKANLTNSDSYLDNKQFNKVSKLAKDNELLMRRLRKCVRQNARLKVRLAKFDSNFKKNNMFDYLTPDDFKQIFGLNVCDCSKILNILVEVLEENITNFEYEFLEERINLLTAQRDKLYNELIICKDTLTKYALIVDRDAFLSSRLEELNLELDQSMTMEEQKFVLLRKISTLELTLMELENRLIDEKAVNCGWKQELHGLYDKIVLLIKNLSNSKGFKKICDIGERIEAIANNLTSSKTTNSLDVNKDLSEVEQLKSRIKSDKVRIDYYIKRLERFESMAARFNFADSSSTLKNDIEYSHLNHTQDVNELVIAYLNELSKSKKHIVDNKSIDLKDTTLPAIYESDKITDELINNVANYLSKSAFANPLTSYEICKYTIEQNNALKSQIDDVSVGENIEWLTLSKEEKEKLSNEYDAKLLNELNYNIHNYEVMQNELLNNFCDLKLDDIPQIEHFNEHIETDTNKAIHYKKSAIDNQKESKPTSIDNVIDKTIEKPYNESKSSSNNSPKINLLDQEKSTNVIANKIDNNTGSFNKEKLLINERPVYDNKEVPATTSDKLEGTKQVNKVIDISSKPDLPNLKKETQRSRPRQATVINKKILASNQYNGRIKKSKDTIMQAPSETNKFVDLPNIQKVTNIVPLYGELPKLQKHEHILVSNASLTSSNKKRIHLRNLEKIIIDSEIAFDRLKAEIKKNKLTAFSFYRLLINNSTNHIINEEDFVKYILFNSSFSTYLRHSIILKRCYEYICKFLPNSKAKITSREIYHAFYSKDENNNIKKWVDRLIEIYGAPPIKAFSARLDDQIDKNKFISTLDQVGCKNYVAEIIWLKLFKSAITIPVKYIFAIYLNMVDPNNYDESVNIDNNLLAQKFGNKKDHATGNWIINVSTRKKAIDISEKFNQTPKTKKLAVDGSTDYIYLLRSKLLNHIAKSSSTYKKTFEQMSDNQLNCTYTKFELYLSQYIGFFKTNYVLDFFEYLCSNSTNNLTITNFVKNLECIKIVTLQDYKRRIIHLFDYPPALPSLYFEYDLNEYINFEDFVILSSSLGFETSNCSKIWQEINAIDTYEPRLAVLLARLLDQWTAQEYTKYLESTVSWYGGLVSLTTPKIEYKPLVQIPYFTLDGNIISSLKDLDEDKDSVSISYDSVDYSPSDNEHSTTNTITEKLKQNVIDNISIYENHPIINKQESYLSNTNNVNKSISELDVIDNSIVNATSIPIIKSKSEIILDKPIDEQINNVTVEKEENMLNNSIDTRLLVTNMNNDPTKDDIKKKTKEGEEKHKKKKSKKAVKEYTEAEIDELERKVLRRIESEYENSQLDSSYSRSDFNSSMHSNIASDLDSQVSYIGIDDFDLKKAVEICPLFHNFPASAKNECITIGKVYSEEVGQALAYIGDKLVDFIFLIKGTIGLTSTVIVKRELSAGECYPSYEIADISYISQYELIALSDIVYFKLPMKFVASLWITYPPPSANELSKLLQSYKENLHKSSSINSQHLSNSLSSTSDISNKSGEKPLNFDSIKLESKLRSGSEDQALLIKNNIKNIDVEVVDRRGRQGTIVGNIKPIEQVIDNDIEYFYRLDANTRVQWINKKNRYLGDCVNTYDNDELIVCNNKIIIPITDPEIVELEKFFDSLEIDSVNELPITKISEVHKLYTEDIDKLAKILKNTIQFKSLNSDQLYYVISLMNRVEYMPGATVWSRYDNEKEIIVKISGQINDDNSNDIICYTHDIFNNNDTQSSDLEELKATKYSCCWYLLKTEYGDKVKNIVEERNEKVIQISVALTHVKILSNLSKNDLLRVASYFRVSESLTNIICLQKQNFIINQSYIILHGLFIGIHEDDDSTVSHTLFYPGECINIPLLNLADEEKSLLSIYGITKTVVLELNCDSLYQSPFDSFLDAFRKVYIDKIQNTMNLNQILELSTKLAHKTSEEFLFTHDETLPKSQHDDKNNSYAKIIKKFDENIKNKNIGKNVRFSKNVSIYSYEDEEEN